MTLKLSIEPKALAGKTPEEQLVILGDSILGELAKSALERDNTALEAAVKRFEGIVKDVEDRISKRFPVASLSGVEVGTGKNQFSLARAACAVKSGNFSIAPYEHEVFKATQEFMETKAASFGVDAAGGFLAPMEVSSRVIERILPMSIAFALGVNRVQVGRVGQLAFNRETGSPTATWVGEMVTASKSQNKYGRMEVAPKAVSCKGDLSNLLVLLSAGAVDAAEERFIRSASRQFALAIDRAILIGASSTEGPVGIVNTPGIGTTSSASITLNKIIAFITKLRKADALLGTKLGWAMTPDKLEEIEIMVDASNQPIVRRAVDAGTMDRIRGYPFQTSTQMGTTGANTMIFGAWDMASYFEWFGGLIMYRTTQSDTALDNDVTRIALRQYGDVGVDQPTAFCVASD